MSLKLSKFGSKLCAETGILELMDDLGQAMAREGEKYMLGGGNPAAIPEMQALWQKRMQEILDQPQLFNAMLGNYDTPQGRPGFIDALVEFFQQQYGWPLSPKNIAITNGSQNAFFFIFNILAGEFSHEHRKKVLLPLTPEYIGYADQGISKDLFTAFKPTIEFIDKHTFKYHVDFEKVVVDDDVALIAASRPTNPTGNVLTDQEVSRLSALAKSHGIPLLIDNAYGAPFPNVIFSDVKPDWNQNTILTLSLSKLGLPGIRTGIVIASEEIISALSAINAVVGLANGNIGQELVTPLLRSGQITELCTQVIKPFYAEKSRLATEWIHEFFDDSLPYYTHKSEGALFFWLWLKDLPISSKELYQRLKERNVIVVSGHYFFYGFENNWPHRHECLRINYTQPAEMVKEGLRLIAEEVKQAYGETSKSQKTGTDC